MLFPRGWGLLRVSNTQPVWVMRFEAATPELMRQYQVEVEAVVEEAVRGQRSAQSWSRSRV